jgi:putative redox protein
MALPATSGGDVSRGRRARRVRNDRRAYARGVFEVEVRNVAGEPAAIGSAGPHTLVVDRPVDGGGRGIGFNGGQLLYLAIAGCVSNDLFREARAAGIELSHVRVKVSGDFGGEPAVSTDVTYDVELEGDAPRERLDELVRHVDAIAEIPNSLRRGTKVRLATTAVRSRDARPRS